MLSSRKPSVIFEEAETLRASNGTVIARADVPRRSASESRLAVRRDVELFIAVQDRLLRAVGGVIAVMTDEGDPGS